MNSQTRNGNKTLLILLLVFILPVAVAKLVLGMDWYHGGATNQGELIEPQIDYATLDMANPNPRLWQVIYLLPSQCQEICRDRLYILHQSHIALGRDQDRVKTLILTREDSDLQALVGMDFTTAAASGALIEFLDEQQLVVVDPLGSLVLRYGAISGRDAQIRQGKAIIGDLRKMLKLSRIG
jgi:hypothetical protein